MKLQQRRALITGASTGLGLAIARAYVTAGANIMICARGAEALQQSQHELQQLAQADQRVIAMLADVSRADQIEALVTTTLQQLGGLDIVVCNAGVYGPKGTIEDIDWAEWEQAVAINLLGTVLLCRAVMPHFKQQGYGKIILLSGGGATNPLPRLSAYAATKAAVVRFGETIAEEVRGSGIDVNSIAPGALNTRLLDEILAAGPEKVGQAFYDRSLKQKEQGGTPLERGAELCVYLGSAQSDGITGKLISAVWDPWETLHERLGQIDKNDIYTLRRIIPKERGQEWG